ncbi:MAG: TIGR02147 family protein [Pseudobdellovibrionaceae bacterium]
MNIFNFNDYKKFVQNWLEKQPKRGHGYYAKMAEALGISAVMVSQVFSGSKNLSLEHGFLLADFLGLNTAEKSYLLLLINYEKAGSHHLREHFKNEIKQIQKEKTENLKAIVGEDISLSETDKAIFYSSWLYSAIRLQTSIEGFQSVEALVKRFQLPREEIMSKLNFLVEKKLCLLSEDGYRMGPQRTHLEANSPYIKPRQVSWRVKAFEKMEMPKSSYLFYTAPMSISEEHYTELRRRLTEVIAELGSKITQRDPEKLACLNIDLFDL